MSLVNGQSVAGSEDVLAGLVGTVGQSGYVAHFAANTRLRFAIEVEFYIRKGEGGGPIGFAALPNIAEQIGHGGRTMLARGAEGETADGADLLLELAGGAGVDREVAGIMRAGSEFVDHE